jgi:hypothetical protein
MVLLPFVGLKSGKKTRLMKMKGSYSRNGRGGKERAMGMRQSNRGYEYS